MNKINTCAFVGIIIIAFSNCSSPFVSYTASFSDEGTLRSNRYATIGDARVFYSEGQEYSGGYSDNNKHNISGTGTIKVLVKTASENNFEEFGLEYRNPGSFLEEINFYIKTNGTYTIYWFDNTTISSIRWYSSPYIKTGINEWNELRIDYNTKTSTFSFYINDSPNLLEKTFNYIKSGTIYYYTSLHNSNTVFPYRIEFKTTNPYTYP
jgi:hypothetical protein